MDLIHGLFSCSGAIYRLIVVYAVTVGFFYAVFPPTARGLKFRTSALWGLVVDCALHGFTSQ